MDEGLKMTNSIKTKLYTPSTNQDFMLTMGPLSTQNIESELSYAYLHAVAAHASVACKVSGRHDDNAGVDAELTAWGPFPSGGYRQEVDVKVQLKATVQSPILVDDSISYSLSGIGRYNDLRAETVSTPRILVVLFLPANSADWLTHSDEALSLRKCAYWVSLRGAPGSENKTAQTVYLPRSQQFDPSGLRDLMDQISQQNIPKYQGVQK
ncbi:MAG: hypothetical protein B7X35_09125 [Halothiobacillus sp. 14-56-357]|nr:MAG: hypothetical protein B7X35_09125 [Halothiobacillus sp. 14-56-357]